MQVTTEPIDVGADGARPASKSEAAYADIRRKIMNGAYGPGYRLVLDVLSREMGISTVPIREAIRRLEAEGYVDFQRNVGARVAAFNEAEFEQTTHVVALLEGYATALAAPHMRTADVRAARKVNREMRALLKDFDAIQFSRLNREFHFVIYDRCPNSHIRGLLEAQWSRLDAVRRSVFLYVPGRSRESVAEHDNIVALIVGGAPAAQVEAAARMHKLRTVEAVHDIAGR
jgi:DNA-binding GntR family transcriptional regulator